MALPRKPNWKKPTLRRHKSHAADEGLPEHLRRCLDVEHEGEFTLHVDEFSPKVGNRKGRLYKCRKCRNRGRREDSDFWSKQKDENLLRVRGMKGTCKWFNIVRDPDRLFNGRFRVYDFMVSFAGQVWTEGSEVVDHNGDRYELTYKPLPMMLRDDGIIFGMFTRGDRAKMKRADKQPWTHTWRLRVFRPDLHGKRCRILVAYRGRVLYEFENGEHVVSHFRAVRRIKD